MDLPRSVKIRFTAEPRTRAVVQGLSDRLGQVFRNLIDNAISFSPDRGTVQVSARLAGGRVLAEVEDDGPGIPEPDIERVAPSDAPGLRNPGRVIEQ